MASYQILWVIIAQEITGELTSISKASRIVHALSEALQPSAKSRADSTQTLSKALRHSAGTVSLSDLLMEAHTKSLLT